MWTSPGGLMSHFSGRAPQFSQQRAPKNPFWTHNLNKAEKVFAHACASLAASPTAETLLKSRFSRSGDCIRRRRSSLVLKCSVGKVARIEFGTSVIQTVDVYFYRRSDYRRWQSIFFRHTPVVFPVRSSNTLTGMQDLNKAGNQERHAPAGLATVPTNYINRNGHIYRYVDYCRRRLSWLVCRYSGDDVGKIVLGTSVTQTLD